MAALIYESLPIFAICFAATLPAIALYQGEAVPVASWWFRLWLAFAVGVYFVSAWVRGGQTIGAKAWRLRVVTEHGHPVTVSQAVLRYIVAMVGWLPFGLGHFWAWFDAEKRGWHDLIARTRLVYLPKDSGTPTQ